MNRLIGEFLERIPDMYSEDLVTLLFHIKLEISRRKKEKITFSKYDFKYYPSKN